MSTAPIDELFSGKSAAAFEAALSIIATRQGLDAVVNRLDALCNRMDSCTDAALLATLQTLCGMALASASVVQVRGALLPRLGKPGYGALLANWVVQQTLDSCPPLACAEISQALSIALSGGTEDGVDVLYEAWLRVALLCPSVVASEHVVRHLLEARPAARESTVPWMEALAELTPPALWTQRDLDALVAQIRPSNLVWTEFTGRLGCAVWLMDRLVGPQVVGQALEIVAILKSAYQRRGVPDDWFVAACRFLSRWLVKTTPPAEAAVAGWDALFLIASAHLARTPNEKTGSQVLKLLCVTLTRAAVPQVWGAAKLVAQVPWPMDEWPLATVLGGDWDLVCRACVALDAAATLCTLLRQPYRTCALSLASRVSIGSIASVGVIDAFQESLVGVITGWPPNTRVALALIDVLMRVHVESPQCVARLSQCAFRVFSTVLQAHEKIAQHAGFSGDLVKAALDLALLFAAGDDTVATCHFADELVELMASFPSVEIRVMAVRALRDLLGRESVKKPPMRGLFERERLEKALEAALSQALFPAQTARVCQELVESLAFHAITCIAETRIQGNSSSAVVVELLRRHLLQLRPTEGSGGGSTVVATFDDDDLDRVLDYLTAGRSVITTTATTKTLPEQYQFSYLTCMAGDLKGFSESGVRYWVAWNTMLAITMRRLRTRSLTNPQQLFAHLSKQLLALGSTTEMSYSPAWNQCRLLVEVVTLLERGMYLVYEGAFCVQMPAMEASAVQFYMTNRKVCEDFFSRIRGPLILGCIHCGSRDDLTFHSFRRLADLRAQLQSGNNNNNTTTTKTSIEMCQTLTVLCDAIWDPLTMDVACSLGSGVPEAQPWLGAMRALSLQRYEDAAARLLECLRRASQDDTFTIHFVASQLCRCYLALGSVDLARGWMDQLTQGGFFERSPGLLQSEPLRSRFQALRRLTEWDPSSSSSPPLGSAASDATWSASVDSRLAFVESLLLQSGSSSISSLERADLMTVLQMELAPELFVAEGESALSLLLCSRIVSGDFAVPPSSSSPSSSSPSGVGGAAIHLWRRDTTRVPLLSRLVRVLSVRDAPLSATLRRELFWDLVASRNFGAAREHAVTTTQRLVVDAYQRGTTQGTSLVSLWREFISTPSTESVRRAEMAWVLVEWLHLDTEAPRPRHEVSIEPLLTEVHMEGSAEAAVKETILRELVGVGISGDALRIYGDWLFDAGCTNWDHICEKGQLITLTAQEGEELQQWLATHGGGGGEQASIAATTTTTSSSHSSSTTNTSTKKSAKKGLGNPEEYLLRLVGSERFLLNDASMAVVAQNDALVVRRQVWSALRKVAPSAGPEALEEALNLFLRVRNRLLSPFRDACRVYSSLLSVDGRVGCLVPVALRMLLLAERCGGEWDFLGVLSGAARCSALWLEVIPQLFARLGVAHVSVRRTMLQLLQDVATRAPQPVLWSALVAMSTDTEGVPELESRSRIRAEVRSLVESLRLRFPSLVSESEVLFEELGRITHMWDEQWMKLLKRLIADLKYLLRGGSITCNADYEAKVVPRLVKFHAFFHKTIIEASETQTEKWFARTYGTRLVYLSGLLSSNPFETGSSNVAADEYFSAMSTVNRYKHVDVVIGPLEDFLAELTRNWQARPSAPVALADVSPRLASLQMGSVTLPGSVAFVGGSVDELALASFSGSIHLLRTKTKPKRLGLITRDGKEHMFLLKGGEDLRLDERIMQLLRFCEGSLGAGVGVRHYHVVPIGLRAGLIEIVGDLMPLYELYVAFRARKKLQQGPAAAVAEKKSEKKGSTKSSKGGGGGGGGGKKKQQQQQQQKKNKAKELLATPVEEFYRVLVGKLKSMRDARRWGSVKLRQLPELRAEWAGDRELMLAVFRELCASTPQDLVSRELWVGSVGSRDWIRRVGNYTKSLATMSMIGYVIGLGDRHLDNILLDLRNGTLLHIDLNVCFERGKQLKVPETVPFRLTQNMRHGLAVGAGLDSSSAFLHECQRMLERLRRSHATLLRMMDTFVLDPIVDVERKRRDIEQQQQQAPHIELLQLRHHQQHIPQEWMWTSEDANDEVLERVLRASWEHFATTRQVELGKAQRGSDPAAKVLRHWMYEPLVLLRRMTERGTPELLSKAKQLLEALFSDSSASAESVASHVEAVSAMLEAHFAAMQPSLRSGGVRICVNVEFGSRDVGQERSSSGMAMLRRMREKLTGLDMSSNHQQSLSVEEQCNRLIALACSDENLCSMWEGWLPYV